MVELFKRAETSDEALAKEYAEAQVEDISARREAQELALVEEDRRRIENMLGLNLRLIQPSRMADSQFHAGLTQDLKISNIPERDADILIQAFMMNVSLFNHTLWMELPVFPKVVHAELEARLALMSSVGGFERQALITAISQLVRTKGELKPPFKV